MKIKILTFHWAKNYGAVLQAYALRTVLCAYCKDTEFLNYRPYITHDKPLKLKNIKSVSIYIFDSIASLIRLYLFGYREKLEKFATFERDFLHIDGSAIYMDKEHIPFENADCVILGSDQIWNCRITNYDSVYFGEFAHNPLCKFVSYAASVGNDQSSKEEVAFLLKHIKNLSYISVREQTAKDLLSAFAENIEVVLDPVLLLNASYWEKIAVKQTEKDFVLIYNMSRDVTVSKIAKYIADRLGIEMVEVLAGGRSLRKIYQHKICTTAGPCDFIGLFINARYVVTSSFHGTAFSLVFNKQFVTVAHPTAGSRQRDLLARIGLSDRVVSSVDDLPTSEIDYSVVNAKLDAERRKSFDFLEKALGLRD